MSMIASKLNPFIGLAGANLKKTFQSYLNLKVPVLYYLFKS
jgi:hypothetical protein